MSYPRILISFLFITIISGAPISENQTPEEEVKEYIIKFKDNYNPTSTSTKISKDMMNLKLGSKVKWVYEAVFNGIAVEGVSRNALEWLQKQDYIEYIEESVMFSTSSCPSSQFSVIDQTNSYKNWGLDRITEDVRTVGHDFNPTAHGSSATIYIVDSGVRTTHQEFNSRARNFYSIWSGNYTDCQGHGTAVAGIAAGDKLGTANQALIENVKVLNCDGLGSLGDIVKGLDYIEANGTSPANESVITMSFTSEANSSTLFDAIESLTSAGFTVVAAAGNTDTNSLRYPAAYDKVISVGAINARDKRPCFSNYGSFIDIYAPGANIYAAESSGDGKIRKNSGTSFAAPFVSGVAAMLIDKMKSGTLTLESGKTIKDQIIADATKSVTIKNLPSGSHNRILYVQ